MELGVSAIVPRFFFGCGWRAELFKWAGAGAVGGSPGCGRPCDHQRQVPAVHCVREREGAPVSVHRQSANCAEDL